MMTTPVSDFTQFVNQIAASFRDDSDRRPIDPRHALLMDAYMNSEEGEIDPLAALAAMKGEQVNGARPTNGRRRTKTGMAVIRGGIFGLLAENHPMTVRQVFYQLVSLGFVAKTDTEYKSTVIRLLTEMRRSETIPFGWIADNTRWMRKPASFSSLEQALKRTAELYRRSIWDSQDVYVEVWLEKDALSGVLYDVTARWDVPLMVTRGYPSLTFLYSAAEAIADQHKPAYLYYFGDRDPSGVDIDRNIEEGIREFAPGADVHFQRIAVTPDQITAWNLPTRPTKPSDTRSRTFKGESVEVDAISPPRLRELTEQCILQHIDEYELEAIELAEESERDLLTKMAANVSNGAQP